MSSYESNINDKIKNNEAMPEKMNFSILKYFWQSNPLVTNNTDVIPKFLRQISVLENFSELELKSLISYLHLRNFTPGEVIFSQNETGVGFYFVLSGHVEIWATDRDLEAGIDKSRDLPKDFQLLLTILEKGDYFGEMALLQDSSTRSATAISKNTTTLLGLFKPDLEEMIINHPKVAAKILQSISIIVANRLSLVTKEMKILNYKIKSLEKKLS